MAREKDSRIKLTLTCDDGLESLKLKEGLKRKGYNVKRETSEEGWTPVVKIGDNYLGGSENIRDYFGLQ